MSDRSRDPFQKIQSGKEASAPLSTTDFATLTRYQLLILDHLRIEPGRPGIPVAPNVEPEQTGCTTSGAPDEENARSCARSIVGRRSKRPQEQFFNFKSGRTNHIILAISIAGLIAVVTSFLFLASYQDSQGGVSKPSGQLIRLSSLRLNGAAVQMLDRQMLPRPWGDQLATGVHIEKNEIYR